MNRKVYIGTFLIGSILLLFSFFYPLPYYVSKPGMAKELEPIIHVENGYDEKGSFMLTTVRMGRANIYSYILGKLNKYEEIFPEAAIKDKNETEEEYNVRQLHYMDASKQAAIEVAYRKAGLPVKYDYKGVYVLSVVPGMPAESKLKVGDRVTKINGQSFDSSQQFIKTVTGLKAGDKISLTYERDSKLNTVTIPVQAFPNDPKKIGVGIALVDDKKMTVSPKVTIETKDIGGPSAGFMFSLEIYNQLTKEDYSKGYKIAGTGTISPDGTVGPIGGIEQKIVAANDAGAEIFFAPNEKGAKDSNYRAAVKTAKDIGSKMKIVPIDTFDEGINYLKSLHEK